MSTRARPNTPNAKASGSPARADDLFKGQPLSYWRNLLVETGRFQKQVRRLAQ